MNSARRGEKCIDVLIWVAYDPSKCSLVILDRVDVCGIENLSRLKIL